MRFFTAVLDFFFPRFCVECGTYGTYLCLPCLQKVRRYPLPLCPGCLTAISNVGVHDACRKYSSLDGLCIFSLFEGGIKTLICDIKYKGLFDESRSLIPLLPYIPGLDSLHPDSIIPVPLHAKKLRTRGYNQSMLLVQSVASLIHAPTEKHCLEKIKNTPAQASLDKKERKENLENAFRTRCDCTGKTVLLVDDVVTTGSTLQECAKTLKKSGAKKVYAVAIAHGK